MRICNIQCGGSVVWWVYVFTEHTDLKQGELTCKGFIYLIELEAQDADGDTDDLWVSLEAMGYDSSLMQNQVLYTYCSLQSATVCMYVLRISSSAPWVLSKYMYNKVSR